MYTSPVAVLRRIAAECGCGYDNIESIIEPLTGTAIERCSPAQDRLSAIRKALVTGEAENVIDRAREFMRQFKDG